MGMGGSGRRWTDHILPCINGKVSVQHDEQLVKGIGADNNGSVLPEAVVAQKRCAADGLDDNNGLSVQHDEQFVKGIGTDNNGSVLPEAVVAREQCAADGLDNNNGLSVRHDKQLVEGIGADNNGSVLPEAVVAQEQCAADGLEDNNGLVLPDAGVARKRCAAEGVVNVQGSYSTLTQSNVWIQVEPAIDNGDDGLAIYDNRVSIPSVPYVTALERRINVLEQSMRQVALRIASHQDLEQRVKDLEQMVQELMRRLVSTVHMSDGQRSTMGSSYNWGFSCTMDDNHRNVAPN